MKLSVTSFGAAREVTGSKHLVEYGDTRILLDCGMFQGRRKEAYEKNQKFGFDPASIDAVVLSHAHIDHCGLLPKLTKEGFSGKIYCTAATAELLEIMLMDSAHIQKSDEAYFSRHKKRIKGEPFVALYDEEDVEKCLKHVKVVHRLERFSLGDLDVQVFPAGHILGSVMVKLYAGEQSLLFSGDLGRANAPLLQDRYKDLTADIVMCESTYGGRSHEEVTLSEEQLVAVVNETISDGGKVIIPAFTLERTQELLYHFEHAISEGLIPPVPMYVDSPMAIKITKLFQKFPSYYDIDMSERYGGSTPFDMANLHFTASADDSKGINFVEGPAIIMAGSGMCESGRIRHHLKNYLEDSRNTIVFVGYMAENTLGRAILDGNLAVNILGEKRRVKARVVKLNAFSGHADHADLVDWITSASGLKTVMLVHGEPSGQRALSSVLEKSGYDVIANEFGRTYTFDSSDLPSEAAEISLGAK